MEVYIQRQKAQYLSNGAMAVLTLPGIQHPNHPSMLTIYHRCISLGHSYSNFCNNYAIRPLILLLQKLCTGGILTGLISDLLNARAITCVGMLLCAVPFVSWHDLNTSSAA